MVSLGFKVLVEYFAFEKSLELVQPVSKRFSRIYLVLRKDVDFCICEDFYSLDLSSYIFKLII